MAVNLGFLLKGGADLEKAVCESRSAALNHDVPNVDLRPPAENMHPNRPGPCMGDRLGKESCREPHWPALEEGPGEACKWLQDYIISSIH